jgi:microcystin-dependent protein
MADQINKLPSAPNVDSSVSKPMWDWLIKMGASINQLVAWVNGYTGPTTVPAHAATHAAGGSDLLGIDSILPTQSGNSGKVLTTNGSAAAWGTISGIPAGAVMPFAMSPPPAGWLECKGQAVSRTNYATLFAAIGTAFGAGDGSTTFALPELRGEFIRGWDDTRGVDSGRVLGSSQADDFKIHTHTAYGAGVVSGNGFNLGGVASANSFLTGIGNTGGTETRPRNIALLFCIKT